ncbi:MAG: MIP/aquaporin family protein [Hyphomicrobiales bacterium]
MNYNIPRKLCAEAIGTFFLLAAVVGSGIMGEQLSGGSVGLALLANALATGAALVVLITMLGPISGAHFNPAVTLAFFIRRDIDSKTALLYTITQIVAGVLGVWAAHIMFDDSVFQASTKVRTGGAQWFSEFIATFGLVFVIFATLRAKAEAVPMAVGLYITAAYWFTSSTSFANPAVTVARSFSDTFAGIRPIDAPIFIAMQILASLVCVWTIKWLFSVGSEK